MRKILIFLLCFCTLFLCFVIPSFADEGVTSRAVPTNLTGATVTVPAGWSSPSGYGIFDINGLRTAPNGLQYRFEAFAVGYNTVNGSLVPSTDICSVYNGSVYGYLNNFDSITLAIEGGNDTDSSAFIQWLVDNDAIISGGTSTYTVPPGYYKLSTLPSTGVPSVGGFITGIEQLYETPVEVYYSSGAVKSYNYFGFVLNSFDDSNNFSVDFTVQLLDIGTSVRIANLTAVDGVCTSQFYGGISRIYFGEDIVTDEPSYQLISFMFSLDTSYLPDEPDVPEFTINPWGYILEMIIDALKVPLFGYFSVWDIFVTICGIFILTWLLKLLAGG